MKKTLLIIMVLAGLFLSASVSEVKAQTNYYYNDLGTKILLTLNEEMVCISIPIECSETIERIRANVDILFSKTDEFFDIYFITRADLDKLTSQDFWIDDSKSVTTVLNLKGNIKGNIFFKTDVDLIRNGNDKLVKIQIKENNMKTNIKIIGV